MADHQAVRVHLELVHRLLGGGADGVVDENRLLAWVEFQLRQRLRHRKVPDRPENLAQLARADFYHIVLAGGGGGARFRAPALADRGDQGPGGGLPGGIAHAPAGEQRPRGGGGEGGGRGPRGGCPEGP